MTMYPRRARPNRWQSLHMLCEYRDHHKPIYPLPRFATVTERGIGLKCASLKFWGLFRDVGYVIAFKLSQYVFDSWNYTPL